MRETISHYRILKQLGSGGMGEVYLAQDTLLDRKVAIKILPADVAGDQQRLHRFVQEAKAASALNHPNVAGIYELGEAEGVHFIVMEHVEGETLDSRIKGNPMTAEEITEMAMQIADALDEAHSRHIIHRDIKPSNIMITTRGKLKVLDFGLAKISQSATSEDLSKIGTQTGTTPGLVVGTVPYMSPEQALGKPIDHRSDIFSTGVVFYQMATGRLPFSADTPTETINRIINVVPDAVGRFNYNIPAELDRIIRKCLEKDPERRYQTTRELFIDLRNFKRDSESGTMPQVAIKPAKKR
ncbi:MAG TPA: serine/threonine-protein kinase, partial [Acidobacteriota bacterium]